MDDGLTPLEIWGGVECTLNRVGETYFDQLQKSGHRNRLEDLDLFKGLGLSAIRYPALFETAAPNEPRHYDWTWADERLNRLRQLGLRPIVGLVHHGSGPRYTNLLDPNFAPLVADYARALAERFSWINDFTPINEPLTTARFSGLYSFWYPHHRSDASFVRALINQCKATILAMQAVREINPVARLIQTEDLGITSSTKRLKYQAEFDNHRRWLSFDLLCGDVNAKHPLWEYLLKSGASAAELMWFAENRTPPDIVGVNHYVTSNRHLDEKLEIYPDCYHGGNGRDNYADVETVRVGSENYSGIAPLLKETYNRYKLPVAVTECHIHAGREDQLRWLNQTWSACSQLLKQGIPVKAVTAWSLLGSYDWNSLVTRDANHYESGTFDFKSGRPRPTALAKMITALSGNVHFEHPTLHGAGWWARPKHKLYRVRKPLLTDGFCVNRVPTLAKPLIIVGANGKLGRALVQACESRGIWYLPLTRSDLDITDNGAVQRVLSEAQPWAVINAAGYVKVDRAETEPEICHGLNVAGALNLALSSIEIKARFAMFSSDLVFDGITSAPYTESCMVSPLNVYGRTKVASEEGVLKVNPESLVVRTSSFFGPTDNSGFLARVLTTLAKGHEFSAPSPQIISPTYLPELAHWVLNLVIDEEKGIWHLSNEGQVTWAELARKMALVAGFNENHVVEKTFSELNLTANRPKFSALTSQRSRLMGSLDDALVNYFQQTKIQPDI